MRGMHRPSLIQFGLFLGMAMLSIAWGQKEAISDPDGLANVRAAPSTGTAIITSVNADEPFEYEKARKRSGRR